MATQVEICNLMLDLIGQEPIVTIDDDSKAAKWCKRNWDSIRKSLLRDHTWNFAVRREQVAAEAAAPAWGFSYEYLLPDDCLRVENLDDDPDLVYRVEGRSLFTDEGSPVNLKYIADVEDTTQFDSKFIDVFIWRMAMLSAFKLTASLKIVQMASQAYLMAISEAKAVDGQEDGPRDAGCSRWTDARQ